MARRGLELALDTSFGRVVLEGDSQILIKAFKEDTHSLANFGHIVTYIPYLASHFSIIDYSHVRRHCNVVARLLTRRAVSTLQFQIWMENVSPDITIVLQVDLTDLH